MESSVAIDVHMELVCPFLKQVANAEGLTILGGHNERGAPVKIRGINGYTFLQEKVNSLNIAMDTGPVDGAGPIVIMTVFI